MMNYVNMLFLTFGLFTVLLNNFVASDHGEEVEGRVKRSVESLGITGGAPALKNEFKLMARLEIRHKDGSELSFCGGSLINNKFVATAKHCLYKYNSTAEKLIVNFDEMCLGCDATHWCEVVVKDRDDGEMRVKIKDVLMPDGTSSELIRDNDGDWVTKGTDFAVVELERALNLHDDNNLEAALLHQQDVYPRDNSYVTTLGWGLQGYNNKRELIKPAKVLQKAELVMKNDRLNTTLYIFTEVELNKTTKKPIAPCAGDSGGPLMVKIDDKWNLLGTLRGYGYDCRTGKFFDEFKRREVWNKIPHEWLVNLLREDWFPVDGYLYKALAHNSSFEVASQQCVREGGILAKPQNIQNALNKIGMDLRIANRHDDVFWVNRFKNEAEECVKMSKSRKGIFQLKRTTCEGEGLPFCQKEERTSSLNITSSPPNSKTLHLEIPRSFKFEKILKLNVEMTVFNNDYDDEDYDDDDYDNELNETDYVLPDPVTITLTAVHPNLAKCLTWQQLQKYCSVKYFWLESSVPNYQDIRISVSSDSNVTTEVRLSLSESRETVKDVILIQSDAGAAEYKGSRLGYFDLIPDPHKSLPAYRQRGGAHFLFYSEAEAKWYVSDILGENQGFLRSKSKSTLPPTSHWQFYNGRTWRDDPTLTLVHQPTDILECSQVTMSSTGLAARIQPDSTTGKFAWTGEWMNGRKVYCNGKKYLTVATGYSSWGLQSSKDDSRAEILSGRATTCPCSSKAGPSRSQGWDGWQVVDGNQWKTDKAFTVNCQ